MSLGACADTSYHHRIIGNPLDIHDEGFSYPAREFGICRAGDRSDEFDSGWRQLQHELNGDINLIWDDLND